MEIKILPAEYIGEAEHSEDGILTIGCNNNIIKLPLYKGNKPGWWNSKTIPVYVRRFSSDLSIAEIIIAQHDGLANEQLEAENQEAENYPLGAKEYWKSKMVGKYFFGKDNHLMTQEDFETYWEDDTI
jgi:hypothetical protein